MSFIFGGDTGTSYEDLNRKRALAARLMQQNSRSPRNMGEGIHAIARGLVARGVGKQADATKEKLDSQWKEQIQGMGLDPARAAIFSSLAPEQRNSAALGWLDQQDAQRRAAARSGQAAANRAAKEAAAQQQQQAIIQALQPRTQPKPGVQMGPTMAAANAGAQSGGDLGVLQTDQVQRSPEQMLTQMLTSGVPVKDAFSTVEAYQGLQPEALSEYEQIQLEQARLNLEQDKQPKDPLEALNARAAAAGLEVGTPEYQQFMMAGGKAPSGTSIQVGPDGQLSFVQGPNAGQSDPKFTESQSKDITYSTRAKGALPTLDQYGDALTSRTGLVAGMAPLGLGKGYQTKEYQMAEQAGQEFLQAILRKDTGAAITTDEQALYGETYLPQPGDGPEVLAQKKISRGRALEALQAGMSPSAMVAQERALLKSQAGEAPEATSTTGAMDFTADKAPDGLSDDDADLWRYATPQERELMWGSK